MYAELSPAAALPSEREPLSADVVERWVWMFVALGIAARVVRYLLCFPLWDDECFLMVNLIDRDYVGLMQPLEYHQVAPLLFLWAERAAIDLCGYNELAMRLVSFACGIASLFLFRHLAKRLLSGSALVTAVGLFAVAYPCVRYSAEAKQYGSDLLVGLVLMTLAVEWRRRPEQARWAWAMAAVAPLPVGLSYPAAFVAGGVSLWLLPMLCTVRRRGAWLAWLGFNIITVASFLGFFWLTARNQSAAELPFMTDFWRDAFPPLMEPWRLPVWFVQVHSGAWLGYPFGGKNGGSTLTFLLVALAVGLWARERRRALLGFCLAPLALNLIAAALHRYPYGGHVKFAHYAAGPICLMTGYGLVAAVAWCARRQASLKPAIHGAVAVLALIGLTSMTLDVYRPYKTRSDVRHRDFARWFWFNASFEGETCCVLSDLKQVFSPEALEDLNWTAMYLCNQQIYSPRHRRREPVHWDRISDDHPLRCVVFATQLTPYDDAAEARWAAEMQTRYDLASRESYPFSYFSKNERDLAVMDHLRIYRFVPKHDPAATAARPNDTVR